MPGDQDEVSELQNCKYCRGITLEKLADEKGYLHAPSRSSLVRSAQKCRLCSLLFRKDRSRQHSSQLQLSLEKFSDDDPQIVLTVAHLNAGIVPTRSRLSLFLYTNPGDPAASEFGITTKQILSNTRSPASFATIRRWLNDCTSTHHCSTPLPLKDTEQLQAARLLDLEAFPSSDLDVRLIDNDDRPKRYATLSYCWGKSRSFITTARNLPRRQARIDFASLPKTFKDCICIARELKIRFLWIDACCIIQDSIPDWQRESAKMGIVYSNAYVTIAADSGTDSNSGCFNTESSSQELAYENMPFELKRITADGSSSIFLWDPIRGSRRPTPPEIDGSPLSERGWVCQERILSARILHYTKSQLFWECRQTLLAEDNLRPWSLYNDADTVPGLARNLYGTTADLFSRNRLLDIWYQNVVSQSYSRRKLTRPEDKLTAISGIARAFHRHFRSKYIAGLWELDLAYALSWRRRGSFMKPAVYRAPSFSWACIDATIEWPLRSAINNTDLTFEEVHIEQEAEDPFGRVVNCHVKLSGQIRKALVTARKRISAGPGGFDLTWELRTLSNKLLGTAFMDIDELIDGSEHVDCLILSEDEKGQVLILDKASDDGAEYFRKGVAEFLGLDKDDEFFNKGPPQTITLI